MSYGDMTGDLMKDVPVVDSPSRYMIRLIAKTTGVSYARLIAPEPLPKVKVGAVFMWRGKMWRRGVGILYAAKPCVSGLIYEGYRRREAKRRARARSFWRTT